MNSKTAALLVLLVTTTIGAWAQTPDRSKPPAPGLPPTLNLPSIQKRQLSNGLPVWIVEMHEVPVAQVNLVVLSGTADDPAGIRHRQPDGGDAGGGRRVAIISRNRGCDRVPGAAWARPAVSTRCAIRLHVPVARLREALPIMADVALRPTFPKDELERLRQQRLTDLIQARDDPSTIAALAFSRVLYGPTHRFGTAAMGTAESVRGFTVDDLRAFYTSTYRPDNATFIVVGDVTPDKSCRSSSRASDRGRRRADRSRTSSCPR